MYIKYMCNQGQHGLGQNGLRHSIVKGCWPGGAAVGPVKCLAPWAGAWWPGLVSWWAAAEQFQGVPRNSFFFLFGAAEQFQGTSGGAFWNSSRCVLWWENSNFGPCGVGARNSSKGPCGPEPYHPVFAEPYHLLLGFLGPLGARGPWRPSGQEGGSWSQGRGQKGEKGPWEPGRPGRQGTLETRT